MELTEKDIAQLEKAGRRSFEEDFWVKVFILSLKKSTETTTFNINDSARKADIAIKEFNIRYRKSDDMLDDDEDDT